jgi:hypothetical protein
LSAAALSLVDYQTPTKSDTLSKFVDIVTNSARKLFDSVSGAEWKLCAAPWGNPSRRAIVTVHADDSAAQVLAHVQQALGVPTAKLYYFVSGMAGMAGVKKSFTANEEQQFSSFRTALTKDELVSIGEQGIFVFAHSAIDSSAPGSPLGRLAAQTGSASPSCLTSPTHLAHSKVCWVACCCACVCVRA